MFYRSLLPVLCVFISCSAFYGSTMVTASSTCQAFLGSSQDPIFTQSHSLTLTTTTGVAGSAFIPITGLDCFTPYGSVVFSGSPGNPAQTSVLAVLDPIQIISAGVTEGVHITSIDIATYRLEASVDIHASSQETFIATGGTGTGFIKGVFSGESDSFFGGAGFDLTSLSVTTPFGSCPSTCSGGPFPFSYQFVFGQPFTMDMESDIAVDHISAFVGSQSAGAGVSGQTLGVTDANGNPILFTVFTPVPEPGSAFLSGTGFLLGTIFAARFIRRSKSMFRR